LARHRVSGVPPRAPSPRRAASASSVAPLLESLAVANYPHPIIAREGWLFIAIAVAVALLLTAGQYSILAALAWLAALFIVQFFRDPPRVVPTQRNAVFSPADGKVVAVGQRRDPHLDRGALKLS